MSKNINVDTLLRDWIYGKSPFCEKSAHSELVEGRTSGGDRIIEKHIHVVHIITQLDLGGAQRVCLLLLDGIKKEGGSASLISGTQGELALKAKKKFDSVFLLDSFRHKISLKNIFFEFKAVFDIWSLLRKLKKKHKQIIVHTHTPKAGVVGRFAAFFAGANKIVHTIHGLSFNKYQPWFLRSAIHVVEWSASLITTHFICVSEADLEICSRLYPRFLKKSSVIHPAVDWQSFTPAKKVGEIGVEGIVFQKNENRVQRTEKNRVILGCISCFKPLKNLFDLFVAFKEVNALVKDKIDFSLEVAGEGKMRIAYEEWIKKNNLQSKIKLLGWRHDTANLMQRWDVFTMSSLKEGLPCSVVEARFAKLPVVAYAVGGIPEIIEHEKNGLLAKSHDVKGFTKNLLRVVEDEEFRQKLAQNSDDLDSFKDDLMNKEHAKLYRSL